jgi:L-fuconolactonase
MSASNTESADDRDANAIPPASGSNHAWDIVDTQLHFSRGSIVPALFAMDALGIRSALIDEFWDIDPNGVFRPGFVLANGASRAVAVTAAAAAHEHPGRLSYILRVDYRDPDLDYVIGNVAADPGGRALRVPVRGDELQAAFRDGGHAPIFDGARKHDLPVFVLNPGNPQDLGRYAADYPDVTIVVDHIGMPFGEGEGDLTVFDDVLALAAHPNVVVKWSHAQRLFKVKDFPFDELTPFLRSALREFGKERIMWGTDISMSNTGNSWAELLFGVRENPALSLEERQWILAGTARKILKWS